MNVKTKIAKVLLHGQRSKWRNKNRLFSSEIKNTGSEGLGGEGGPGKMPMYIPNIVYVNVANSWL